MSFSDMQPVQIYCANCGFKLIGYRARDQTVRFKCGRCGVVMISARKTKRIVNIEVQAPPNQALTI